MSLPVRAELGPLGALCFASLLSQAQLGWNPWLRPLQLSGLSPSMISLDPHANPGVQNLLFSFTMKDAA